MHRSINQLCPLWWWCPLQCATRYTSALTEFNDHERVQLSFREACSSMLYAHEDLWGYTILKQAKNYIKDLRAQGQPLKQHMVTTVVKAAQALCFISIAGNSSNNRSNAGMTNNLLYFPICGYCGMVACCSYFLFAASVIKNWANEFLHKIMYCISVYLSIKDTEREEGNHLKHFEWKSMLCQRWWLYDTHPARLQRFNLLWLICTKA